MKQIVIISRISPAENQQEFNLYCDNIHEPYISHKNFQYKLLIINGGIFSKSIGKNAETVNLLIEQIHKNGFSVSYPIIVAYHYQRDIGAIIERGLYETKYDRNATKVIEYSSTADSSKPLYEILKELGAAIKKSHNIDAYLPRLWDYLNGDPTLQVNLSLLHNILSCTKIGSLDFTSNEYSKAYQAFLSSCPTGYDNKEAAHREALKKLRDELLANYQS